MSSTPKFIRIDWNDLKSRVFEVARYLPQFAKDPVTNIKHVPSWDWITVLILQVLVGAITGVAGGIVTFKIFSIFVTGLIGGPIFSLAFTFFAAGLFYYAFIFVEKIQLEFRKVYIMVVLSFIPFYLIGIFQGYFKPIVILGILATGYLLKQGFISNFLLEEQKTKKIVMAFTIVWALAVVLNYVEERTSSKFQIPDNYTPGSLDVIQKELDEKSN